MNDTQANAETATPDPSQAADQRREDLPDATETTESSQQADAQNNQTVFPIVALGASAGGLEALERFFVALPTDTGMAFVVIQHLDPTHNSLLTELLGRYTDLPVQQVTNGMNAEPNQVYVIPPNSDLSIIRGELRLVPPAEPRGFRLPIDSFFRALAVDQGNCAIGIILSGTGSDGSSGLRTIKENDGMVMAQAPDSAKFTGMPDSAIATHLVDFILPPEELPQAIIQYYTKAIIPLVAGEQVIKAQPSDALQEIFALLRREIGHDFAQYKPNTIVRRIERRMIVNHFDDFEGYLTYLQRNRSELEQLFKEMLIGVTNFFRDREAFEVLRSQVIPKLFEGREQEPIRVWVPACSTGEEAYSIAILLQEYMDQSHQYVEVQIFATDIDDEAVAKARMGIYAENIVADVPPDYLQKYFTFTNDRYSVNKKLRSMVVVATQSLVKDPPFSRLDLISCRNLLIYLNSDLQKNVIAMFHYALNRSGYLFVGNAETLNSFPHLFEPVDKKTRIFRRVKAMLPRPLDISFHLANPLRRVQPSRPNERPLNVRTMTEKVLLDRYAYPSVIVDEHGDILYFHGDTDPYLRPATGEASLNILRMSRQEIRSVITTHLRRVLAQRQPVVETVQITSHDQVQLIRVIFQPLEQTLSQQNLVLVIFELVTEAPITTASESATTETDEVSNQRIAALEHDLHVTREYLLSSVEDFENSNENLTLANEELQSSNEELQSTNEELETAKEELQSINEELITVNAELGEKVEALHKANEDQINLFYSIDLGLIFLDERLLIRLFNPIAAQLLNLMVIDAGRPIRHFAKNFDYVDFTAECERVLDTLIPLAKEVVSHDQRWFLMQIRPYRTEDDTVQGLVVTFADITEQKAMQEQIEQREYLYRILARHLPSTVALLFDNDLRFVIVEGQGLKAFGLAEADIEGQTLKESDHLPKDLVALTTACEDTLRGESVQLEISRGDMHFAISTTPIYDTDGVVEYGLLIARHP